ncbi:MAG: phosphate ABC transporter permease subunit PstC [Planctomycetota bacterium]|nr:phosphate ABC transporter permease subunit PstC [Planctomycetota bacterium]
MQGHTGVIKQRSVGASLPGRPRSLSSQQRSSALIKGVLFLCVFFSVCTTVTIIAVLLKESVAFFMMDAVSFREYATGTKWAPLLGAEKHFGVWPLITGTLLVTVVAAAVALPLGVITAMFLSEYAPRRVRAVLKPILEVLAGVPTVVYGFFALMVLTPSLQWLFNGTGPDAQYIDTFNALSAGIAVGIMCLPIVCSLSEDAMQAVPRSLREGAYALGGTRFDVSVKVVFPAALSGIMSSYLLAIARAVGETMIVALAAGASAKMAWNPGSEVQTMTGYIVQIYLGDTDSLGVEYYSTYAIAATLFIMTLLITWTGYSISRRFRQVYE